MKMKNLKKPDIDTNFTLVSLYVREGCSEGGGCHIGGGCSDYGNDCSVGGTCTVGTDC